jgi:hypothetical protein
MEFRLAAFTVREVLPLANPNVAEIVVLPTFFPVARPLVVIDAMEVEEDFQVATPVTSWLVPSEKVPTAVYC